MSELAKTARAAMRAKAARLTAEGSAKDAGPGDDPSKRIDASGWQEPVMNADAQTGMRPVSRRQYKSGGAVHGEHTKHRADRKARKSGGKVDGYINRDVRAANAEIAKPHIGGFAHGGGVNFRKQIHGMMGVAENKHGRRNAVGKFERSHKAAGGGNWIAGAIKHPGALHRELHVPEGKKIPAKKLEKAEHSDNPKLAKRAHLAETLKRMHKAEGGAAEDVHKHERHLHKGEPLTKLSGRTAKASGGSLNSHDPAGMRPKGDRVPRKHGGKAKGKTNIIIGIHAGGAHQPPQMPPGAMPKPMAPPPASPPQMPAGGPPMGGGMPPGGMAGMMPPNLPMPRKSGGRAQRAEGGGTKPESYWTYQPGSPTPTLDEAVQAKAIHPDTTQAQWNQMSPGMRREIMRGKKASGGKVVGAKYADASIAKAEKVKSEKGIPAGAAGGLGRLAKRSIARKDGFVPV